VNSISLKKIASAAPFTDLSAQDGALVMAGENGVDVSIPAINVREKLNQATLECAEVYEDFTFTGDSTETDFTLPNGWKPYRVYVDGSKQRKGSAEDYTVTFDGFTHTVSFAAAPANNAEIDVEAIGV
jgi:hypothetical protein